MELIEQFDDQRECEYKGERYLVRDNGAVLRLPREGQKPRPLDNQWTFGTPDKESKYMSVSSAKVHIIVATAFYGPKDSKVYVVDHIDTNRCNNRRENLRWLTRLENILLNDTTRAKIEYICGSVEAFLENPELLRGHESTDKNFAWMRTVSKEESANTLAHWKELSAHPRPKKQTTDHIGKWIFGPVASFNVKTPNQIAEEEHQRAVLAEQKKHAEQERREAQKRETEEKTSRIIATIIATANECGCTVDRKVKGTGWKADLMITSGVNRIAIRLFSTSRKQNKEDQAMREEGIKCIWLTENPSYSVEPTISFAVETNGSDDCVRLNDVTAVPVADFIEALVEDRVQMEETVNISAIKVRFVAENCYRCGALHHIYFVLGSYDDQDFYEGVGVEEFDPIVVESIRKYISGLPRQKYRLGAIKERKYLSFGCPECDAMIGDHFVSEVFNDYFYKADDEDVHRVELIQPMVAPCERWVITPR